MNDTQARITTLKVLLVITLIFVTLMLICAWFAINNLDKEGQELLTIALAVGRGVTLGLVIWIFSINTSMGVDTTLNSVISEIHTK